MVCLRKTLRLLVHLVLEYLVVLGHEHLCVRHIGKRCLLQFIVVCSMKVQSLNEVVKSVLQNVYT